MKQKNSSCHCCFTWERRTFIPLIWDISTVKHLNQIEDSSAALRILSSPIEDPRLSYINVELTLLCPFDPLSWIFQFCFAIPTNAATWCANILASKPFIVYKECKAAIPGYYIMKVYIPKLSQQIQFPPLRIQQTDKLSELLSFWREEQKLYSTISKKRTLFSLKTI